LIDTTNYPAQLSCGAFNLTVEGNGVFAGGTLDGGSGTLTLNNSVSGSSGFTGATFTGGLGTLYLKNTTTFTVDDYTVFDPYNIKIADSSIICVLDGSRLAGEPFFIWKGLFSINGGAVTRDGDYLLEYSGLLFGADAVSLAAGSDLNATSGGKVTIKFLDSFTTTVDIEGDWSSVTGDIIFSIYASNTNTIQVNINSDVELYSIDVKSEVGGSVAILTLYNEIITDSVLSRNVPPITFTGLNP
jgi:hypothetical protein